MSLSSIHDPSSQDSYLMLAPGVLTEIGRKYLIFSTLATWNSWYRKKIKEADVTILT